ncbi:MAG TPA: argininosuccinate lyase [Blastocatellia bacterium]
MKLWGGRFKEDSDARFARFNASFSFDRRLLGADVKASKAHTDGLVEAGLINQQEASDLHRGLDEILNRFTEDADYGSGSDAEDVHSFVESELHALIGNTAYKLHTGRSRNDQVATDLRLFLREETDRTIESIVDLQFAVVDLAELYTTAVMPGYTHLQRAQPVLFAHYLLAYYEMLNRDMERFLSSRARTNRLPLGAGALAGTGFQIDRQAIANALGFESVTMNSLDAVSDRDFVIEFVGAAAILMVHLSRLAEDFIIYSTEEFGFIELSDKVSTGSSLMPQKKNPDSLELIRGKAGRVFGHHAALLATMKGLPMAYDKDMQEDKEALFDTIDTIRGSLEVMEIVMRNVRLNTGRAASAAAGGYSNATDLADYLVRRGLEFRRAHEVVGRIVNHALSLGKPLEDLPIEEYLRHSELFEDDVYRFLTIDSSLSMKAAVGGTSPERVTAALAEARKEVELRRTHRGQGSETRC